MVGIPREIFMIPRSCFASLIVCPMLVSASLSKVPRGGDDNATIYSVNLDKGARSKVATLSGVAGVYDIALANSSLAYAISSDSVYAINLQNGTYSLVTTVSGASHLIGLALANNTTAYVVDYNSNSVYNVNLTTGANSLLTTISGNPGPGHIAIANEMLAYVVGYNDGNVYSVNLLTGSYAPVTPNSLGDGSVQLEGIALSDFNTAYVKGKSDDVYIVDLQKGFFTPVAPNPIEPGSAQIPPPDVNAALAGNGDSNSVESKTDAITAATPAPYPIEPGSTQIPPPDVNAALAGNGDSNSVESKTAAITAATPAPYPIEPGSTQIPPPDVNAALAGNGDSNSVESKTDAITAATPAPCVDSSAFESDGLSGKIAYVVGNSSDVHAIHLLRSFLEIPGASIGGVALLLQMPTAGLTGNNLSLATYLNANAPINVIRSLALLPSGEEMALESVSPARNAFSTYASQNGYLASSQAMSDHLRQRRFYNQPAAQAEIAVLESDLVASNSTKIQKNPKIKKTCSQPSGQKIYMKTTDERICCRPSPYAVWVSPFGEYAREKAQNQTPEFNMNVGGVIAAFDYNGIENNAIGAGSAYVFTYVHDEQGMGHAKINQGFLTFYGTVNADHFYFDLGLWGGYYFTSNERQIAFFGVSGVARSHIHGWQLAPHFEFGYDGFRSSFCSVKWFGVEPFLSLDWVANWENGFEEKGATSFNMGQEGRFCSFLRGETGLRFHEIAAFSWGSLVFREKGSYMYQKTFHTGQITAFLVGSPGSFSVSTLTGAQNLGVFEFSMLYISSNSKAPYIDARYQGEFGLQYQSHQGVLEIGKSF